MWDFVLSLMYLCQGQPVLLVLQCFVLVAFPAADFVLPNLCRSFSMVYIGSPFLFTQFLQRKIRCVGVCMCVLMCGGGVCLYVHVRGVCGHACVCCIYTCMFEVLYMRF